MNGENVEKVYRLSLKRERDRERQWRKSKRYGDIRNVTHFYDFEKAEVAEESPAWLSDSGKGVEQIVAACDGEGTMSRYQLMLKRAREKVRHADPKLLEVFELVVKNGKNRKESIWELAKKVPPEREAARKRYWRDLNMLLTLFGEG